MGGAVGCLMWMCVLYFSAIDLSLYFYAYIFS